MGLQQIIDRLFPSVVCGTNARMKALLAGQEHRTLVSPAEVEERWRRLRTPTAIERLNDDVDRAIAAAEAQMVEEKPEQTMTSTSPTVATAADTTQKAALGQ